MVAGLMGWQCWEDVSNAGVDGALLETWVAGELRKKMLSFNLDTVEEFTFGAVCAVGIDQHAVGAGG